MSSTSTTNSFSNDYILNMLSRLQGSALLDIIESFNEIHQLVEQNMPILIKKLISQHPEDKPLWELHESTITIEQFKTNLKIQEFALSNKYEKTVEYMNTLHDFKYGTDINYTRKLLYGMLYYDKNYLDNVEILKRLVYLIQIFDNFSNEGIKFFIKVITFSPAIGDIPDENEANIIHIYERNEHDIFFKYLQDMISLKALPEDIVLTFLCFGHEEIETFKIYCEAGIKSKDARELIDEKIPMTTNRMKIYFELLEHYGSDSSLFENNQSIWDEALEYIKTNTMPGAKKRKISKE